MYLKQYSAPLMDFDGSKNADVCEVFAGEFYLCSTKQLLVQHQVLTSVAPNFYLSSTKHYLRSTKYLAFTIRVAGASVPSVAPRTDHNS